MTSTKLIHAVQSLIQVLIPFKFHLPTYHDKLNNIFNFIAFLHLSLCLSVSRDWSLERSEATLSVFSIPATIVRKYASNLDKQKTVNRSHPPPTFFWQSIFFSAPLQKQKLNNDLICEVESRIKAKLITCLFRPTFFKSSFWFL